MTQRFSLSSLGCPLGCLVAVVAGLFLLSFPAFAQSGEWAKGCGAAGGTIERIFCSLSTEFRFIPKALALLAYAGGVFLAIAALLQLKQYGDDPSRTPFREIVIKFVLAALLISLPLAMQVVVKTVTGKSLEESSQMKMKRPCSARGSAIGIDNDKSPC